MPMTTADFGLIELTWSSSALFMSMMSMNGFMLGDLLSSHLFN